MKPNNLYKHLLIALSAFMLSTATFADDKEKTEKAPETKAEATTETAEVDPAIAEGKALFDKANCLKCHDTKVFTRKERKVTDLEALGRQTRMCQQNLGVQWFDEDTDKVIAYLNHEYYKFPKATDAKPAEAEAPKVEEDKDKSAESESQK